MKTIKMKILTLLIYLVIFASCGQAQNAEKLTSDKVSAEEIKLEKRLRMHSMMHYQRNQPITLIR